MPQLKLSKSTEKEIDRLYNILNEIDQLKDELSYKNWYSIDKTEFEILYIKNKNEEEALEHILKLISESPLRKALFNLSTLLENYADPECDTLEFNKDISRGLELLELEKEGKLTITDSKS